VESGVAEAVATGAAGPVEVVVPEVMGAPAVAERVATAAVVVWAAAQ
jgi:hypothetical protein